MLSTRREKSHVDWRLVLLFLLMLPLLPIYLFIKGRLDLKWAAGLCLLALVPLALVDVEEPVGPSAQDRPAAESTPPPSETPRETATQEPTETPTETPSETRTEAPSETPTDTASVTPTDTASATASGGVVGFAGVPSEDADAEAVAAAAAAKELADRQAAQKKAAAKKAADRLAAEQKAAAAKAAAAKKARAEAKRKKAAAQKAAAEKAAAASDPLFGTCGEANDHGYGNYRSGRDPEYSHYQDRDHDGVVCEF